MSLSVYMFTWKVVGLQQTAIMGRKATILLISHYSEDTGNHSTCVALKSTGARKKLAKLATGANLKLDPNLVFLSRNSYHNIATKGQRQKVCVLGTPSGQQWIVDGHVSEGYASLTLLHSR